MELDSIFFNAYKAPVSEFMPDHQFDNDITHCVVVEPEPGIKRVVNFCSEDYNLQTNREIVDPFLTELSKYFQVKTVAKMRGYSQFFMDFIIMDKSIEVVKKDKIFPKIRMVNSYDGKVKYQFEIGLFRLVCTNGLTAPVEGSATKYKLMHTPGLSKVFEYGQLLEDFSKFLTEMGIINEHYQALVDQPVKDLKGRIDSVLEDTEFPSAYKDEVYYIAEQEMVALGVNVPNDWVIYNAFNNILNHSPELKAKESKKSEIDLQVMNYLYSY